MDKTKYLNDVISAFEAEQIISKLENIDLIEFGSFKMMQKHVILERLNMQAHKNSLLGGDDYILDFFISEEKIKKLIEELFVADVYKTNILPLIKERICDKFSLKAYISVYFEAILINLLDNFFFHVSACIAADDYLVDIINYAYDKVASIAYSKASENSNIENEFDEKQKIINFNISMSCLSILRYITDHLTQLPFPVKHCLMNTRDVPMLLVSVIESKPWFKYSVTKSGEISEIIEHYDNGRWSKVNSVSGKLNKYEAQAWIAIYNLFSSDNGNKYEITEFRKNHLLRLRKYMNELLYDQIPPLQQLFRSLEELSLMNVSSIVTQNSFVVEMQPMLYNYNLNIKNSKNFKEIAEEIYSNNYLKSDFKAESELFAGLYSIENLEYFMDDPKCAMCNKDATNRCSRCKTEWYCSKDCQKLRWKLHKEFCNKYSKIISEEAEQNTKKKNISIEEEKPHIIQKKLDELD